MANYDELQEILAEIESESKGAPSKSWSLDDIDALLAGDDIKKEPVKEPEKIEEEFEEELEDEETFEDEEEIEEEPEEVEETPKKKRKFSIKAINILPQFDYGKEVMACSGNDRKDGEEVYFEWNENNFQIDPEDKKQQLEKIRAEYLKKKQEQANQ